jgi:steroid delta-isomerase-like uncharacterized protein
MADSSDVIQRWADAWSAHDMTRLTELFVDDCIYEDVTLGVVNRGKDELTAFGEGFFVAAPGLQIELVSHWVSGARAAAEWWFKGTQEGEVLGLPATGKPFAFRGMSAFELSGDKITRCSDYWDLETFKRQLGF